MPGQLWEFLYVSRREYDIIKRLWPADARKLARLQGDRAAYAALHTRLRARLRKLKQKTNDTLKTLRRRTPNMKIEPWRNNRGRGLRRKGDTGEPPA
jgi:hypothetical protein